MKRSRPDPTLAGIAVSAIAFVVMVALGRSKRRVGRLLKSNALLADSVETFVCAYLSAIVLVGLALNAIWSWWWADSVAALAICPFLLIEAVEAWAERCTRRQAGLEEPASRFQAVNLQRAQGVEQPGPAPLSGLR